MNTKIFTIEDIDDARTELWQAREPQTTNDWAKYDEEKFSEYFVMKNDPNFSQTDYCPIIDWICRAFDEDITIGEVFDVLSELENLYYKVLDDIGTAYKQIKEQRVKDLSRERG